MAENENKPKKPHSVRGKHRVLRQKSWTDKKGKLHTKSSWEYEPRSGYGSAFLSTFTLFLAIVVVFNIVMGTGYKGYKQAVRGLYATTETVGGVVQKAAEGIGFVFDLFTGNDDFVNDQFVWEEYGKVKLYTGETVDVLRTLKCFEDTSFNTLVLTAQFYRDSNFLFIPTRELVYVVLWSNLDDFEYGDVCTSGWFFGDWLKNERNNIEWRGMEVKGLDGNKISSVEDWLKEKGYIQ